jgi:hypothetical protein
MASQSYVFESSIISAISSYNKHNSFADNMLMMLPVAISLSLSTGLISWDIMCRFMFSIANSFTATKLLLNIELFICGTLDKKKNVT